ncbi:MAG: M48 family metalloprotease [Magnetovibrio sp.]|nr:M48 family metalloprotease [Magnetovibrio sp.]
MALGNLKFISAFMALLVIPLSGCSVIPATGETSFAAFMTPDDEVRVGQAEHSRMLAMYGGVYSDETLLRYVDKVGRKIARGSEMSTQTFSFTVLNSLTINAFALPGGYVYITRGLLSLLNDEAELAGVLAHEVAHITARHAARRYSRSTVTGISSMFLLVLTGGLSEIAERASKYYSMTYGREQEGEADVIAVRYLKRSGYDLWGLSRVLDKMQKHEDFVTEITSGSSAREKDWMASHPSSDLRLSSLKQLILSDLGNDSGLLGRGLYLSKIDNMPLYVNSILGPARLDIVSVEYDMTMRDLAGAAQVATHLKWLEVVNGLEPDEIIPANTKVKLIVYDAKVD